MKLTEFEKTILLSFFILVKGSTRKYIPLELLLSKFPVRQRKSVIKYVKTLTRESFLIKEKRKESYKIGRKALKQISTFLVRGPRARV